MRIKKIVGASKSQRPIQRVFELKKMLEELRGKKVPDDNGYIRKIVGRPKKA